MKNLLHIKEKFLNKILNVYLKYYGNKDVNYIRCHDFFFEGDPKSFFVGKSLYVAKGAIIKVTNLFKQTELRIGSHTFINNYTIIDCHFKINIGDRVQIGPQCYICDFDHDLRVNLNNPISRPINSYKEIIIENDVWIGAGVKILKGVKIGCNSVIGAGSVVTKNIPEGSLVVGNPARVIKKL